MKYILARVGHRVFGLNGIMLTEDAELEQEPKELPPGTLRVTLRSGRVIDLRGRDAVMLRKLLVEFAVVLPEDSPVVSQGFDVGVFTDIVEDGA